MPLVSKAVAPESFQPHGGDVEAMAARFGRDPQSMIDFSASINPFGPPAEILAAVETATQSLARYPEPDAAGFLKAVAAPLGVGPEFLLPGNGSAELLYWLLAWLKPKRVLTVEPGFIDYRRAAGANSADILPFYLEETAGFSLKPPLLERALKEVDAVVLGRPNNPTGGLIEPDDLTRLADARPNTLFIIDEAFIDFVEPPVSLIPQAVARPNMIVLRSLTKMFALPGLRIGYLAGHADLVAKMRLARPPWPLGAAQIAAGRAGARLFDFISSSRRRLSVERAWLFARLQEIRGLAPLPSRANFILVKTTATGTTGSHLATRLGERGICVRDCRSFRALGPEYIRLAVKARAENTLLIDTLKEVI